MPTRDMPSATQADRSSDNPSAPSATHETRSVQRHALRGMSYDDGAASLAPGAADEVVRGGPAEGLLGRFAARGGAGGGAGASPVQRKLTVGTDVFDKPHAKSFADLRGALERDHGAAGWKRGWIGALQKMVGEGDHAFTDVATLATQLEAAFPARDASETSPAAELLRAAFEVSAMSLVGFIWKACSTGIPMPDGSIYTRDQLIEAFNTKAGREFIDARWRDTSGATKVGQTISGQHEWILTSDVGYVIANAKSVDDIALWFMAAEILRTPTTHVIFDFQLSGPQIAALKSGQAKTLAELQAVNAHAGGLYAERDGTDEKKQDPRKFNVQVAGDSPGFHKQLQTLLRQFLTDTTSDLDGYLTALEDFQRQQVWDGAVTGLEDSTATSVETGFYKGAASGSQPVAASVAAWMKLQAERYDLDRKIMLNRMKALRSEVEHTKAPRVTRMAVDIDALDAVDPVVKGEVIAKFTEMDEVIRAKSAELREHFKALDPGEGELRYRAAFQPLYDSYIAEKQALIRHVTGQ